METAQSASVGRSKRIFVLGATGGTGLEVVKQALDRGHRVTAFVRSPRRLSSFGSSIEVRKGDPCEGTELAEALVGHDAVVSALGHRHLGRSSLLGDSARALAPAMRSAGLDRVLVVSVALLFQDAGFMAAIARETFLRNVVPDSAEMERVLASSNLDWTVARPPLLTNGPRSGHYAVTDGGMPRGAWPVLSRADLADFLVREVERPSHERRYVGMGTMRTVHMLTSERVNV